MLFHGEDSQLTICGIFHHTPLIPSGTRLDADRFISAVERDTALECERGD